MKFATIEDAINLWRPMSNEEMIRAENLIPIISDVLREEAKKVGKNIDELSQQAPSYANVLKSVVIDVLARTLMTSTDSEPMTQTSESALGYSWSGNFLIPGGGLFIKDSELKRLGLKTQKYGVIEFYDTESKPY